MRFDGALPRAVARATAPPANIHRIGARQCDTANQTGPSNWTEETPRTYTQKRPSEVRFGIRPLDWRARCGQPDLSPAARRGASNRRSLPGADEKCWWRRYALNLKPKAKKRATKLELTHPLRGGGSRMIRACPPRTTARASFLGAPLNAALRPSRARLCARVLLARPSVAPFRTGVPSYSQQRWY